LAAAALPGRGIFLRWPRLAQASLLAGSLFLLILLMQSDQEAPFVYQGF
jgi:hypothetical protein